MPVFNNPRQVIVIKGGDGWLTALLALAGLVMLAVAVAAVAWWAAANAVALEAGALGIVVVLTVSIWVLRRWFTVMYWNPDAAPRPRAALPAAATVVVHRHVVEYAPAAIENPSPVITAAVMAAALEAEEVPR